MNNAMLLTYRGDAKETLNVCEHGDHPAPVGMRFCSEACQRCEFESVNEETGCDNLCGLDTEGA